MSTTPEEYPPTPTGGTSSGRTSAHSQPRQMYPLMEIVQQIDSAIAHIEENAFYQGISTLEPVVEILRPILPSTDPLRAAAESNLAHAYLKTEQLDRVDVTVHHDAEIQCSRLRAEEFLGITFLRNKETKKKPLPN